MSDAAATNSNPAPSTPALLAVDAGVRTGLALFGRDGRLRGFRSKNLGNAATLRRAVGAILADAPGLACVVVEGGGPLADAWRFAAERRGARVLMTTAEQWRAALLLPREQRSGAQAKTVALERARAVIAWSGLPGAPCLRHDAAEAILAGLWGVMKIGWLLALPYELRR